MDAGGLPLRGAVKHDRGGGLREAGFGEAESLPTCFTPARKAEGRALMWGPMSRLMFAADRAKRRQGTAMHTDPKASGESSSHGFNPMNERDCSPRRDARSSGKHLYGFSVTYVHHAPHPHSGLRQISSDTRSMAPWWMHAGVMQPGDHSFRNTFPRVTESIPFLGGFFAGISLRSRNCFSKRVTSVVRMTSSGGHSS